MVNEKGSKFKHDSQCLIGQVAVVGQSWGRGAAAGLGKSGKFLELLQEGPSLFPDPPKNKIHGTLRSG